MALYEIKNIVANPFRHIARYPIRREKVAALRESLRKTGFWDNVVARARNGKAEIAYGHHRLAALKEEFGPSHKVELIIRKLDDEAMIQIMARENMEEWGTSASVEQETIRAVVQAYADGLITLPSVSVTKRADVIRYAPSFSPGKEVVDARPRLPYTTETIAEFIGWLEPNGRPQKKVYEALTALQFIDEGILKESDFDGLSTKQAGAVIEEARQAQGRRESAARVHRKQAEAAKKEYDKAKSERERAQALKREGSARKQEQSLIAEGRRSATTVGRAVSASLKTGEIGYRQARDIAERVDTRKKNEARPDIALFAERLAANLNTFLDPDRDDRIAKLEELVRFRESLDEDTRTEVISVLEAISERALNYANQLSGKPARTYRALLGKGNSKHVANT